GAAARGGRRSNGREGVGWHPRCGVRATAAARRRGPHRHQRRRRARRGGFHPLTTRLRVAGARTYVSVEDRMPIPLISEQDFEREVLRANVPVLVDLYADWCQPCKQLTPILEQISQELSGKLKIVRVDVEKSQLLARSFRVQSIPMLVLIAQGRPVDQIVG